MVQVQAVIQAAEQAGASKDEDALAVLLGMRQKELDKNPALADDPNFTPVYGPHMGLLDDVKALGWRIAKRWAKELYGLVCENKKGDTEDKKKIMDALNLSETAVIGAVAAALMAMAVPALIAAAAAPLITKKFIWPLRDELCGAWGEALNA
jgi:hypothetical protein